MSERIYTVSKITREIKSLLLTSFGGDLKITGEISNYKLHFSGHLYFSLKDEKALIKAVMFNAKNKLKGTFSEGDKVIVSGNISVYEPQGNYQIIVNSIEKSGQGELYKEFLKIKEQLSKQGLFDEKNKIPIPSYPLTIGIITSETGAVIKDIDNVLKRRAPYIKKFLFPAKVQGDDAYKSLIKGIEFFNNDFNVDVIIIGRGGGSIEDLWAFNNENLAYKVFESRIPIISAVGHETDFTIIDFVADVRAPTPSAAAEIAVKDINEINNFLLNSKKIFSENLINRIENMKYIINTLKKEFYISGMNIINTKKQLLADFSNQIDNNVKMKLKLRNNIINKLFKNLTNLSPEKKYVNKKIIINSYNNKINNIMKNRINLYRNKIDLLYNSLNHLSPLNILDKGYSLVYNEKNDIINNSNNVKIDDTIYIRMKNGKLKSKIIDKE